MTGSLSQTRGRPEPGRELDALIAEKVMGWTDVLVRNEYRFPCGDGCGGAWTAAGDLTGHHNAIAHLGSACVEVVPRYSTDIAAAFTVVEKMRALTPEGDVHLECMNGEWSVSTCYSRAEGGWDSESWHVADTLPHAICLAALAALSPADDGGAR